MSFSGRYNFKNMFQNSIYLLYLGDGFGDFEDDFMLEWGNKLALGTNYFTYPMGNVLNLDFEEEGIEIDYSTNAASSSGTANIPADVVDQGSDHSLVKFLSGYDIGASSLYLNASFVATASSRSKKEYILSNGNGMYWECSIR
ncbi:hypothetical protein DEO72_LG8g1478 [Vigna unguiculata]|uniref:Uncharacterized protein n=1 Tax=Vigna unguiculata TaxID=3917 RepID=A0A4D6MRP6_VIGUN|nr:hypothetical protein DEO72_LG8g1478 [Vigna unguiculata]